MRVSNAFLNLLESLLTDRSQITYIRNFNSDSLPIYIYIYRGVQQGSILSPLLFNCFINDLLESQFSNHLTAYADDLKLFGIPGTTLHKDLQTITDWTTNNEMKITTSKCEVLHIGAKNPGISYHIVGAFIPTVNKIRDLGLIVDKNLSFRDHVCELKLKALRLIAMLFKSFSSKSPRLYLFAYLTYILPIVEYCSVCYSKNSATNTKVIEKIPKIFSRKPYIRLYRSTSHLIIPSYCDRLKLFQLPTLESRSTKADLLTLYKIIHNHISVPLFRIILSSFPSHTTNNLTPSTTIII